MHIIEFCNEIERIINEQVVDNFPIDWDEDFITRSILKEFRNKFKKIVIRGYGNPIHIKWLPYKFTGKPERVFGDIALIVKLQYMDGDTLEGVAFIEAKKRYKNKINFDTLKFPQLKKILKKASRSMVLLYDYEKITNFVTSHVSNIRLFPQEFLYSYTPYTHSVIIPTNIVTIINKKDTSLYKFSLPFSRQLCFRYLYGFDLEFQEEAIKIAKGYNIEKIGAPKYLLIISIAPIKIEYLEEPDFNREVYIPIE